MNYQCSSNKKKSQDDTVKNNQNKHITKMTNENLVQTGFELKRKSVSWADDKDLVEMCEIEVHRRQSLSCKILKHLCCMSKSEEQSNEVEFISNPEEFEYFGAKCFIVITNYTDEKTLRKGGVVKMAEYSYSENQSIKDSVKSLKKYGSTCNHIKRLDYYVTHAIQKTDTLQGLAVKYNTTTEQIRRINRLFASDSLFLRDHLKIPVSRELANSYETNNCHSGSVSDTITSSVSTESFTDEDEKSVSDLFGKIDNSIAGIRAQVKQVQEHSSVLDSTNTSGMLNKNHYKMQSHLPYTTSVNSNNDVFVTPHPVVLNRGRKVKSSLQRLEKEQDELFEL